MNCQVFGDLCLQLIQSILHMFQVPDSTKGSFGCKATLRIRVKRSNRFVHYRDSYAKRGLYGVITVNNVHSHLIDTSQALQWLRRTDETKKIFLAYFNEGRF